MSISPSKQPTLSRQSSSTSLNVGLPPALPESTLMNPSSPSSSSARHLKRSRSRPRIRRGDVESSATSDAGDDSDITPSTSMLFPSNMVKASPSINISTTPRHKVAGPIEPATMGRAAGKGRETLQERLAKAAAAKIKKSRSVGDGLAGSESMDGMSLAAAGQAMKSKDGQSGSGGNSSDKVVVCVRIKPTTSDFIASAYELATTSLVLSDNHPNILKRGGKQGREAEYTYTFDMLLRQPSTTPDLYSAQVAPLVEKAMNGFNSTVFAYGQTGSGKSFTMTGHPAELGIIPCAVDGVFDAITADRDRAFLLRVSYIEIYNETLRDLLNFKKTGKDIPTIHTNKGKVYVDPLVEEIVSTPQDVMKLLSKGNEGRKVGATDWNDRSSRSHCVFTIVIESRPRDGDGDDDIRLSRLNLIDLAGSEKAVSDLERRGEGKHINQSLLALREVINKLTEKKRSHIPYRNSKLTHLLENALGGDSNICVICTISAEEEHASETLETLKFAGRCSQVETKAKKNVLLSSERALIRAKDAEIEELKQRLQLLAGDSARSGTPSTSSHVSELADSVADLENRKARLKDQLAKLNGEILTSELPRLGMGFPLSPPRPKRRRISEFLGVTKPSAAGAGRRAVSGLIKVEEDTTMQIDIESFEGESVATLRRALLAKDTEVSLLRVEMEQLRSAQASSASIILDKHHDIETTRADLVSTIEVKTAHIDKLEETILDLRKSREDLLVEDQIRLDEIQRKLDQANMELERSRRVATGDLPTDLAMEKEAHRLDLEQIHKSHEIEVGRMKREIKKLGEQAKDRWKVAEVAINDKKGVEMVNAGLKREVERCKEAVEKYDQLRQDQEGLKGKYEAVKEQAKRVDFLESANTALKAEVERLSTAEEKIRELEGRLKDSQAKDDQLRSLTDQLSEVESGKDALRADRMAALAKAAELEVTAVTLLEKVHQRDATLEQQKLESDRQIAHFRQEAACTESATVTDLREQLAKKAAEVDRSTEMVIKLEQELVKAKEQVAADLAAAVEAKEHAVRSVEESKAKLAALEVERDTARGQTTIVQAELSEQIAQVKAMEKERDGAKGMSDTVQAELDRARTAFSVSEAAKKKLEVKLDQIRKADNEKDARLADLTISYETVSRQLIEMRESTGGKDQAVQHLQAELAQLATELDNIKTDKTRMQSELDNIRKEVITSSAEIKRLRSAQEVSKEEMKLAQTERVRQAELVVSAQADFERVKQELELKRTTVLNLEKRLQTALEAVEAETKRADRAMSDLNAFKDDITRGDKATQEEVVKLRSELTERSAALGTAEIDVDRLRADIDLLNKQMTSKTAMSLSQAEQLRIKDEQLQDAKNNLAAKSFQLDTLHKSIADGDGKVQQLRMEVDDLTRQLENSSSVVSAFTKQVEQEKARVVALEADLFSEKTKSRREAGVEVELDGAKAEVNTLTTRLAVIEKELQTAKSRNESLVRDLAEARSQTTSTKSAGRIIGTLPTIHSSASISNLASKGITSSRRDLAAIATAGEKAEIERLEKVIEAQQEVIDDQREKIKFWSNELEKQREVVKMLTSAPDASQSTPTANSPKGTRHIKAHSVSSASPAGFSPALPSGTATISGMPKKSLTSTFTARNLALPTSPTPLPMHTAQYSNTATRKGRRITIDHDMDVLTEVSKVGTTKAIFESPEKNAMRSGVAGWSDSPKQRRP